MKLKIQVWPKKAGVCLLTCGELVFDEGMVKTYDEVLAGNGGQTAEDWLADHADGVLHSLVEVKWTLEHDNAKPG